MAVTSGLRSGSPTDEACGHERGSCPLGLSQPICKMALMFITLCGSEETYEVAHRTHSVSPGSARY